MEYDPVWWVLAFPTNDRLARLVIPTQSPSAATIGYIGVAPEMRGKGYEEVLLVRGTATLLKSGAPLVRGDTDGDNRPMAKVFRNVGYRQFATRREFKVSLRWEQTWDQVLTPLAPGEIEVWPEDPLD